MTHLALFTSTNDVKSTGASLFQLELYHDVHSSLSKYHLASCLFKEMVYGMNYVLWLSGVDIVAAKLNNLKCNFVVLRCQVVKCLQYVL